MAKTHCEFDRRRFDRLTKNVMATWRVIDTKDQSVKTEIAILIADTKGGRSLNRIEIGPGKAEEWWLEDGDDSLSELVPLPEYEVEGDLCYPTVAFDVQGLVILAEVVVTAHLPSGMIKLVYDDQSEVTK